MEHPLEQTKLNKNLLRVAAEIAGKGTQKGEMGLDEIEVIKTNGAEKELAPEVEATAEPEVAIAEEVELFANIVLEQLQYIEKSLDCELTNEDLDYAIDRIIDNLLSEG